MVNLPLSTEGSKTLRQLIRQHFAWPGGYEIFFVTPDGSAICVDCARSNYQKIARDRREKRNTGWLIRWAATTNDLNESIDCDECRRKICIPMDE